MNRSEFHAFCEKHNFTVKYAGRNRYSAEAGCEYLCAVIKGPDDFEVVKPLLDSGDAYLFNAKEPKGQGWFEREGQEKISDDNAKNVAKTMARHYAAFLEHQDDIHYYFEDDIDRRNEFLKDNPALEGESEDEHFTRVEEMLNGKTSPPLHVNESGYWLNALSKLILSYKEFEKGFWSYSYGNWSRHVILVLNEKVK